MCAGFGRPFGRVGGESRRGRSSRIERAAEIAARSAARCTRPLPVTAPAIATSASAAGDQHEAAAQRQRQRLPSIRADLHTSGGQAQRPAPASPSERLGREDAEERPPGREPGERALEDRDAQAPATHQVPRGERAQGAVAVEVGAQHDRRRLDSAPSAARSSDGGRCTTPVASRHERQRRRRPARGPRRPREERGGRRARGRPRRPRAGGPRAAPRGGAPRRWRPAPGAARGRRPARPSGPPGRGPRRRRPAPRRPPASPPPRPPS